MRLHFLSGLPRSGSTLLANILCQNPEVQATATSGMIDLLAALRETRANNPTLVNYSEARINALCKAVLAEEYKGGKTFIDKSRGWVRPGIIETMTEVLGYAPKIIATVRPVPDCVASFVRLIKPDNVESFCKSHPVMGHLRFAYESLQAGFAHYPDHILFVEYDRLMQSPGDELARIYDFLGLPGFAHDFANIANVVVEDDEKAWGIKDLHTIRPVLSKIAPDARAVLGDKLYRFFDVAECWNPSKPTPLKVGLLDEALACALRGDFAHGEALVDQALALDATDNRAKFNKGWYELARGKLQTGMALLAAGRGEDVFGNAVPSAMPMWDGEALTGKTLLLNLEGGLGDQICNARFAAHFARLGAKVMLAGAPELAALLLQIQGATAFVSNGGAVYHDYWVPSMSAALLLGLEYGKVDGQPYLPCTPKASKGPRLRVGLRWAGNPHFEHEQHRRFDPAPLFALPGVDLVSLQRDSDVVVPDGIEQPALDTWQATQRAIESLDLVISSCTSVAHLAAAMGKPTWIIVPVLPYYLWALPGERSPWYGSVRLFRQTVKGEWADVFERIAGGLATL